MKQPENSSIKFYNTHPVAWGQQKIMLQKLKELPNYIETEIYHNWDSTSNEVSWHYSFQPEENSLWESKVVEIIQANKKPS
jgi:hypothetical protein